MTSLVISAESTKGLANTALENVQKIIPGHHDQAAGANSNSVPAEGGAPEGVSPPQ